MLTYIFTLDYILSSHVGLSGIFDAGVNGASTNTKESSVMSFLSAVEPRAAQAAASGTALVPQLRAPSWQTGDSLFSEFLNPVKILIKMYFLWPCHYGSVAESDVNS